MISLNVKVNDHVAKRDNASVNKKELVEDVTERKEMEEALQGQQGLVKTILTTLYPAIEKQDYLSFFKFRMKTKNGEIFPTEHSVFPLKDYKNRIGLISIGRDITERKEVEEVRQESEEKYRVTLAEYQLDGEIELDRSKGTAFTITFEEVKE